MKARIRIKRMAFVAFAGIAGMMLTSCMHMALGMIDMLEEMDYQLAEYTDTYTSSYSSSSSYSSQPVAASYQKAPANVYMTAQGRLVDSWIDNVWRQCYVRDFDGNGEINCCDKATAFCIKWRQYNNNRIRLCQQQTRSLNHMYVQIWLEGYGWWSVDPAYKNNGTHDMKAVWGNNYNRDCDSVDAYWITVFSNYIY
ncbi:MAG: transglutaminase-like domain-containing protein [Treponema sp.]|nr:transglutaminase-like domain-containing protein [Treponema sp.]